MDTIGFWHLFVCLPDCNQHMPTELVANSSETNAQAHWPSGTWSVSIALRGQTTNWKIAVCSRFFLKETNIQETWTPCSSWLWSPCLARLICKCQVTVVHPNRRQQKLFTKSFREKFEQIKVGDLGSRSWGWVNNYSVKGIEWFWPVAGLPVNVGERSKPIRLKFHFPH